MAYVPALPRNRPPVPGYDYLAHNEREHRRIDVSKSLANRRFIRDYQQARAARLLKHLPGLHNQKSHGNQFAKTPWLFDAIVPNMGPAFPDPHKWTAHVTSYARDPVYREKFNAWYSSKAGKDYIPWSPLDEKMPPPIPDASKKPKGVPDAPDTVPVAVDLKPDLLGTPEFKQALQHGPVKGAIEAWSDIGHHFLTGTFSYDYATDTVSVTDATFTTAGSAQVDIGMSATITFDKKGHPTQLVTYTEDGSAWGGTTLSKPTLTAWDEQSATPEPVTIAGYNDEPASTSTVEVEGLADWEKDLLELLEPTEGAPKPGKHWHEKIDESVATGLPLSDYDVLDVWAKGGANPSSITFKPSGGDTFKFDTPIAEVQSVPGHDGQMIVTPVDYVGPDGKGTTYGKLHLGLDDVGNIKSAIFTPAEESSGDKMHFGYDAAHEWADPPGAKPAEQKAPGELQILGTTVVVGDNISVTTSNGTTQGKLTATGTYPKGQKYVTLTTPHNGDVTLDAANITSMFFADPPPAEPTPSAPETAFPELWAFDNVDPSIPHTAKMAAQTQDWLVMTVQDAGGESHQFQAIATAADESGVTLKMGDKTAKIPYEQLEFVAASESYVNGITFFSEHIDTYLAGLVPDTKGPRPSGPEYVDHDISDPFYIQPGWTDVNHLKPGDTFKVEHPNGQFFTGTFLGLSPNYDGQGARYQFDVTHPGSWFASNGQPYGTHSVAPTNQAPLTVTRLEPGPTTNIKQKASSHSFYGNWKVSEKRDVLSQYVGREVKISTTGGDMVGMVTVTSGKAPMLVKIRQKGAAATTALHVKNVTAIEQLGDNFYQTPALYTEGKPTDPGKWGTTPQLLEKVPDEFKPYLTTVDEIVVGSTDTEPTPAPAPTAVYAEHVVGDPFSVPSSWEGVKHLKPGHLYGISVDGGPTIDVYYTGPLSAGGDPIATFKPYDPTMPPAWSHLNMNKAQIFAVDKLGHPSNDLDVPPKHLKLYKYHQNLPEKIELLQPYVGYKVKIVAWDGHVYDDGGMFVSEIKQGTPVTVHLTDLSGSPHVVKIKDIKTIEPVGPEHYQTTSLFMEGVPSKPSQVLQVNGIDTIPAEYAPYVAVPGEPEFTVNPHIQSLVHAAKTAAEVTVKAKSGNSISTATGWVESYGTEGFSFHNNIMGDNHKTVFVEWYVVTDVELHQAGTAPQAGVPGSSEVDAKLLGGTTPAVTTGPGFTSGAATGKFTTKATMKAALHHAKQTGQPVKVQHVNLTKPDTGTIKDVGTDAFIFVNAQNPTHPGVTVKYSDVMSVVTDVPSLSTISKPPKATTPTPTSYKPPPTSLVASKPIVAVPSSSGQAEPITAPPGFDQLTPAPPPTKQTFEVDAPAPPPAESDDYDQSVWTEQDWIEYLGDMMTEETPQTITWEDADDKVQTVTGVVTDVEQNPDGTVTIAGEDGYNTSIPYFAIVSTADEYGNTDTSQPPPGKPKPTATPSVSPAGPTTPTDHDPYADPSVPIVLPSGAVDKWDTSWDAQPYKPKQSGSNPGGFYTDSSGRKWYIKVGMHKESYQGQEPYKYDDRSKNETIAARLYEAAGVKVPTVELLDVRDRKSDLPGGASSAAHLGVKSEIVGQDGQQVKSLTEAVNDPGFKAKLHRGFAVDAWIANWDVAGTGWDNILSVDGEPLRVDVGGSMLYRAQGGLKAEDFTYDVKEIETMRGKGKTSDTTKLFADMTDEQVRASFADTVAKITDADIDAIVDSFALSDVQAPVVKDKLKKRRFDMAEKLGINLPDHPEINFKFQYENKKIAHLGFNSHDDYDDAVSYFGSADAVEQVNSGMSNDDTGYKNVAAALAFAQRTEIKDPVEFIRVARAAHSVRSANGYDSSDMQMLNNARGWSWSDFADTVTELKSGPLAEKWKPIDWVEPDKWAGPWAEHPPQSYDPWVYHDWKVVYEASPKFATNWDGWMQKATDSHAAGITAHVTGLIDESKYPAASGSLKKPSASDVADNNFFKAHLARTKVGFTANVEETSAADMAKAASQAWGHTFKAETLTSWGNDWGGSANNGTAVLGLQWAALERYGFDLESIEKITKPAGSKGNFFRIYNPHTEQWITLSFSSQQWAYLADYKSNQTLRDQYLAALAGWNYGAQKQWAKAGVEKVAVVRGTKMTAAWCEQNGIPIYSAADTVGVEDIKWSEVGENVSQRGVGSFGVNLSIAASGGIHGSGGGPIVVVWRAVFLADDVLGAKGYGYPNMSGGGGEGEIMMPAGVGYEVAAFDSSVDHGTIVKYLGDGVQWTG